MKQLATLFFLILVVQGAAQTNTEIYLFDLMKTEDDTYELTGPLNISKNEGYDNQPSFWPDGGSILYARTVNGQTEIARYFVASGKTKIITNTLQGSEYSPTPTPDGAISSIRLDTTGLQLLYQYDLEGNAKVLIEDEVIGYHTWLNENQLAAFVLGEPSTLKIFDLKKGKSEKVAENLGRSLHKIPRMKEMTFVDKSGDNWIIKMLDPKKGTTRELVRTIEGSEDFCWTPNGEMLMGQNEKLWMWNRYKGWTEIADISRFGLQGITRLAISPEGNMLAIVVNK